jgi:caffeoyl-CoA O-methyltransferase/tricin synthase
VQYILDTTVLPNEPECMRELRLLTNEHERYVLPRPPTQLYAELLLFFSLCNLCVCARDRTSQEVHGGAPGRGAAAADADQAERRQERHRGGRLHDFTSCSLLATALALPDDGKVVAIDVSREYYELGLPFIEKAGVAHKVDFREGPALERLDALLADDAFDFAFVDADKPNYVRYHEQLLRLVRLGGAIVYDNTLWDGTVALPPDAPMSDRDRRFSAAVRDLNARLAADPRVEVCQLAVADGVTICRRVV